LSIQRVSAGNFALVSLIIFGGLTPTVMNLRVRCWAAYECKLKHYIEVPTKIGLIVDASMLILALAGTGCVFYGFGGVFTWGNSGDDMSLIASKESFNDFISFCLAIVSGILIGVGLGQTRILCGFNLVREKDGR